jgi:hypothetical protein
MEVTGAERAEVLAAAGTRDVRGTIVVADETHGLAAICGHGRRAILVRRASGGWRRLRTRPPAARTLVAACSRS